MAANVPAALVDGVDPVRREVAGWVGEEAAGSTWLVGGVVRDALLGRPLPDVDIATAADPEPVARAIARATGGTAFRMGDRPGDEAGCWRVVTAPGTAPAVTQYDVCALRGGALRSDLAARDFAANALAVPLVGPLEVVDHHGGLDDVATATVRMVDAAAFDDDPLRMLRAARLAHVLGWTIDQPTCDAIRTRSARAAEPAGERTFAELRALLLHPEARRGWRRLEALDLDLAVLPELRACHGIAQSAFHHLDVHEHTLAVLDNAEDLLAAPDFWLPLPDEPGLVATPLDDDRRLVVLLAALLHDLGKPGTRAVLDDGRVSFAGHDTTGVVIAGVIADRWRLSNVVRRDLGRLVGTHLALGYLLHGDRSPRDRWRFRQELAPVVAEGVLLSVADRLATAGVADRRRWVRAHLDLARTVWADHWREQRDGVPRPLLDGRAIADVAGVPPGPRVGEFVAALAEAQAVGEVTDRAAAEQLVRSLAGA
ncbi:MAG: polynucleotide adenylyltransferase/metal dependent phosphohydrolase [Thermoleophilia bacterium]|nr:polynucleotide adenylyltransferase/metal dependent phosphohydrolase [Thermoleophilia bacterium]